MKHTTTALVALAGAAVAATWLALRSRKASEPFQSTPTLYSPEYRDAPKCFDCAAPSGAATPSQAHWNVSHGAPQLHVGM
jgi:hypothetical protein